MHQGAIPEIRKAAEDAFASGLFCAESVVAAIANAQGVDPAPLQKAATAFCSGSASAVTDSPARQPRWPRASSWTAMANTLVQATHSGMAPGPRRGSR